MFARIKWWSQHADLVEGRSRQRLDLPKKNRESIFIPINIPFIRVAPTHRSMIATFGR